MFFICIHSSKLSKGKAFAMCSSRVSCNLLRGVDKFHHRRSVGRHFAEINTLLLLNAVIFIQDLLLTIIYERPNRSLYTLKSNNTNWYVWLTCQKIPWSLTFHSYLKRLGDYTM